MPTPSLPERLKAAGVPPGAAPVDAWRELRRTEGVAATIIDLYDVVASARGLTANQLPLAERKHLARSAMADVWPGFEVTEFSERLDDPIRISDADPAWDIVFQHWRERLSADLGEAAVRIEHVGSTSVPGLPAKQIVDIQISVRDLEDESRYVPQLERSGNQLRSRDELHRYFRPFPDYPRDRHIHVCASGSTWEREHLLFRDYLRTHAPAGDRYAAAKRAAAAVWADDGWAYTDAKSQVIQRILREAEIWAASSPRR